MQPPGSWEKFLVIAALLVSVALEAPDIANAVPAMSLRAAPFFRVSRAAPWSDTPFTFLQFWLLLPIELLTE